jgi:hypothetical protein
VLFELDDFPRDSVQPEDGKTARADDLEDLRLFLVFAHDDINLPKKPASEKRPVTF